MTRRQAAPNRRRAARTRAKTRAAERPAAEDFRDVVVVLMAGGGGVRFWPLGTAARPKQFLTELTGQSLYVQAAKRARQLAPWDRILVLTHERFAGLVREQTPEAPAANVILEPCRRDTAPAVVLAAVLAEHRWPGAVMVVLPSDHLIDNADAFRATLARAVARARQGGLGTIGIRPTYPATGYGYLRLASRPRGHKAVAVERFVEKPPRAMARKYLAAGRYLWNSGMFIWRASALLEAAARHLPEVHGPLSRLGAATGTPVAAARARAAFEQVPAISLDYGIMEKSRDVWTVPAALAWSDVGGWLEAADLVRPDAHGNRVRGTVVAEQAGGNVVITEADHPVLVAGLRNCVIVHGPAGTLVCHKAALEHLKSLVKRLPGEA